MQSKSAPDSRKAAFLAVFLVGSLLPVALPANPYVWDNENGNGVWNDPVDWGLINTPGDNVAPTAGDSAIFRSSSPAGTVTLTDDGFAQKIRQNVSAPSRIIAINASQAVDRTLTLSGTAAELLECTAATANLTLDGTSNGNGARLKLKIDGTGTGSGTLINAGVTLAINCDVSGVGGFIVNAGQNGSGTLLLGGSNTYSGVTTVNAGTLQVNGSIAAASAVTINSGATLAGMGIINGPAIINSGGLLSPGPGVGALTFNGGLTLKGNLLVELDKGVSPSNDWVSVTGTLTNGGTGNLTVQNTGASALLPGDTFRVFSRPLLNGQALHVVPLGAETWTNRLALDGTITVLTATNAPPISGDPTSVFVWTGAGSNQFTSNGTNWTGQAAPPALSSNIWLFQGDLKVPYNWPHISTNYGTTILIFSNNIVLNGIKILAGMDHTVNFGSYVLEDQPANAQSPSYFGIDSPIQITWQGNSMWVTNANFTNALGDASCGSQTDFRCVGGRLDVYGVLKDGAGTSSRLVKSGSKTLNITGMKANLYTGGTIVNNGPIKMQKPAGVNAIPGDVTVNGTGGLIINVLGGEQIADTAVVTLNDSGYFDLIGQPETVRTLQSTNTTTSVLNISDTLTVAPLASGIYNRGAGVSEFAGSMSGSGTLRMNGNGTYGMMGDNSVGMLTVNSGTLEVNGNSGTGPVSVAAGTTLLGQGTIVGAVTVAGGGTIGAGFSAGKLSLPAGLNLNAGGVGATNVWELAALKDGASGLAGMDYDQIEITGGTLALGSQATLDIHFTGSATAPDSSVAFWQTTHTWNIVVLNGGSNPGLSNFTRIRNGSYAAGTFTAAATEGGIVLTFTPAMPAAVITGISNAGPGIMTVRYSNTLNGTSYTLVYATNLSGTPTWYPATTKSASGASDFQIDLSATNRQRFYRIRSP